VHVTRIPTLDDVPPRSSVILGQPHLGLGHTRRLAELGLRAGARVRVVLRTAGGGRVIAVDESRIALDRQTLRRIPVTHVEREPR
jgi:Fe2+ transport system protein FeoA